ncbi:TIGR01777 family oxidoreductase [Kyrpidia sp.]|uniref:TIGR01777 family oxidoreductase n=1 Tax=Kyrpidia sp. TaxID=2073077 RepID=UPI002588D72C|nr:TIGR01777 family oxidoreductase [Kyrpidia sp.]MCL6577153.1 TIGR01777 family oxidoreductase [Kyrpidia sp.]
MIGQRVGHAGIVGVTGGTGFVGRALIRDLLHSGYGVMIVTRDPERFRRTVPAGAGVGEVEVCGWDVLMDRARRKRVETWVHLAGEPIAGRRWSKRQKEAILRSRAESTRRVVEVLSSAQVPGGGRPVLVSASAVGFYGTSETAVFTEEDPGGDDFLATVVKMWEEEALRAEKFGARVVRVRLGVVLGREGGALPRMVFPYRLGIGGRIGTGRQWVSWVHLADAVGLFRFAIERPVQGAVNAVSPNPVTMETFGRTLARVLGRPYRVPVPGAALRVVFGEGADVLLRGQRVLPKRAEQWGYVFRHPDLEGALADIFKGGER